MVRTKCSDPSMSLLIMGVEARVLHGSLHRQVLSRSPSGVDIEKYVKHLPGSDAHWTLWYHRKARHVREVSYGKVGNA